MGEVSPQSGDVADVFAAPIDGRPEPGRATGVSELGLASRDESLTEPGMHEAVLSVVFNVRPG